MISIKNSYYIFIIALFISFNVFAQKEYQFDYFTTYDYKKNLSDSIITYKDITYSNSKDNSYRLDITIKSDTVYRARLLDYKAEKLYIFKDGRHKNNLNDINLFKSMSSYEYDLNYCKQKKRNQYEIKYYLENGKKIFNIKRFKNKRKKLLINESFYQTIPSGITKNQHYNFPVLSTPLWCEKFTIDNDEVISHSYFIEKGNEIMHIRKLSKIEKTDYTIIIPRKLYKSNL